jgi:hypothetical protein
MSRIVIVTGTGQLVPYIGDSKEFLHRGTRTHAGPIKIFNLTALAINRFKNAPVSFIMSVCP